MLLLYKVMLTFLAIADISAAETKKITLGDAVAAGLAGGVPDGSIPGR